MEVLDHKRTIITTLRPCASPNSFASIRNKPLTETTLYEERDPKVDEVLKLGEAIIVETIRVLVQAGDDSFATINSGLDDLLGAVIDSRVASHGPCNTVQERAQNYSWSSLNVNGDDQVDEVDSRSTTAELQAAVTPSTEPTESVLSDDEAERLLRKLGSTLPSKERPYFDVSRLNPGTARQPARGGYWNLFPERLHQMLETVELEGNTDIVSFLPHGRSFRVHNVERFSQEILPRFFVCKKWGSFLRQLSLYGFLRVNHGVDKGAYYHCLFLRGRKTISYFMGRSGKNACANNATRKEYLALTDKDPDFYSMPFL
jgi:hypothetical protein